MGELKKFKNTILNLLTLSYPKQRFFVFLILIFVLMLLPLEVVSLTAKASPCSLILKENCPSAGITRGVSSLLKGNFHQAFAFNPLSGAVLFVLIAFLLFDFRNVIKNN